jgi:pimeloyl-ACP methyl ester carboxylesterase
VRVGGRGVSYVRAGQGPPIVLLHAGPSSGRTMLAYLRDLADDHTVYSFDNAGTGESDRLGGRRPGMAQLADALADALVALKVPRCPVYGNHTGAALALELGRRHPDRTSALILDGPCAFTAREAVSYRSERYFKPSVVDDSGSHLLALWVQAGDIVTWFPWSKRLARYRKRYPALPPAAQHEMVVDRLRAGDGYPDAYGAAFVHDGAAAAAALTVPAVFMAHDEDSLYGHLRRLPPLRPNQRVARYRADSVVWADELVTIARSYRGRRPAPPDPPFRPTPGAINRRYVDIPGGQLLVRSSGERRRGRPLLLLHDGRASSRVFEPLIRELAGQRAIYAPDLPDNGASDRLAKAKPAIADYADAVARAVTELGLGPCDVVAVGASAGVGLELLTRRSFSTARLVLDSPDFYAPAFARRLAGTWAPPLTPEWDGSHLSRLWLMLRDEYAFWPWFDRSALRAADAPSDWREFHARVADLARSVHTYHRLTEAALRYDWKTALRQASKRRLTLALTASDPRRSHVDEAARNTGFPAPVELPAAANRKAPELLRLLAR